MQEEEEQVTTVLTVLEGLPELIPSDAVNLVDQEDREGRATLSHSSLNSQLACHQKYAYEYVDRIEAISKPAGRRLGAAFAKAIEAGDPEVGVTHLEKSTIALTQEDEDRLRADCAITRAAATAYLAKYGVRPEGGAEFGYRVRLRNPHTGAYSRTFDLEGYADGLVRNGSEGAYKATVAEPGADVAGWTLIEDKFVGQISAVQIRRLKLDRQLALECYGIWRATGESVTDVLYRFTRKPSIKQKKGETIDDYCARVEADYVDRPEFYLLEEAIERTPDDLVRIEAELWQWADQRRAAQRAHVFPRNSSHCHDYGGCPFLPLCVGDPDAPSLFQPKQKSDRTQYTDAEVTAAVLKQFPDAQPTPATEEKQA
jgi:hypothetical protein